MSVAIFTAVVLLWTNAVRAQEADADRASVSPVLSDFVKGVVLDPTTYAPAGMLYHSMRLDWKSSQPFFQHGFVEDNPRYTVSGLGHDVAVSYGRGNQMILMDSLAILPMSITNNATSRLFERMLTKRYSEHGKLIRTLGWIERMSFASYLSYQLSAKHFRQWQANELRARQLGFK